MRLSKRIWLVIAVALALVVAGLACNRVGSSPTATLKGYFEALQKKDADGLKKTLSKGTLELFDRFAKAQTPPTTLDEALKKGLAGLAYAPKTAPETRNEKIEGDRATLEVKNEKYGTWETVPFVKEDGQWKIAFDQMLNDSFKSSSSGSGAPATGTAGDGSSGNANANANK